MCMDLGRSPFLFSKADNKFVFEGCGNAVLMDNRSQVLSGCSTNCYNDIRSERNNCFGSSCCQNTIPHNLKSYNINITRQDGDEGACGSAFLADESSYALEDNSSFVPISLLWTLSKNDTDQARCSIPLILEVDLGNGNILTSYVYDGLDVTEECARCEEGGNDCYYDTTYDADGLFKLRFRCIQDTPFSYNKPGKTSLGFILGLSISIGVLFVVATSYLLYKLIKKTKDTIRRKKFFKRNGGLLLKQRQEVNQSLVDKTTLFTSYELEKATDNFSEKRILGRGGQGTIYKGMLVDGRIVAVKKSKVVDESQLEQFINEVVILSQVNHRNVVNDGKSLVVFI